MIISNCRIMMKTMVILLPLMAIISSCTSHKNMGDSSKLAADTLIISWYNATTKPEFPGGEGEYYRFLKNNFKYPYHAKVQGEKGQGRYDYVINRDGVVTDVQVVQGVGYSIDKTMVKLIKKMPKWKPGTLNGEPVSVRTTVNWNFGTKNVGTKEYDTPARFGGDSRALEDYLEEYSEQTRGVGMTGLVKVSFVVDEKGDVTNPRVIQGLNYKANSIALRIVRNMPRWTPATKDKKPIQVNKTVSIHFSE